MKMRIRINELLEARGLTAYAVARASGDRISLSTIYRLREREGRLDTFAADMLEALCDVFEVTPGELLERDDNGANVGGQDADVLERRPRRVPPAEWAEHGAKKPGTRRPR